MSGTLGDRIAAEALALVGTPFRFLGRDAATGLDCVGLAICALARAGVPIGEPAAYALRGTGQDRARAMLRAAGLVPVAGAPGNGDILLAASGPLQLHIMVRADDRFVHAHAGLGRVVEMPIHADVRVLGAWRARGTRQAGE